MTGGEPNSLSGPRYQIVLIEDAESDVFLVREALELANFQYDLCVLEDGEKAVEYIEGIDRDIVANSPHLLLLDLNLPKKSGVQVLERLRKSPRCANVPVVVLTSSDSPRDRDQVLRLGITQYFRKASKLDEYMRLGPLVRHLLSHEMQSAEA
jgi:DNA-binding response OmpR family regulator